MAKKWYPVVDILSCIECGTCVTFCSHGVYDKEKVPSPVVVNPVLIALLAIVAGKGNLLWGILLMLLYSIGHSTLVMIAGTSVGFVQKINSSEKYKTASIFLKILMGTVILLIGLYMFWLAF